MKDQNWKERTNPETPSAQHTQPQEEPYNTSNTCTCGILHRKFQQVALYQAEAIDQECFRRSHPSL